MISPWLGNPGSQVRMHWKRNKDPQPCFLLRIILGAEGGGWATLLEELQGEVWIPGAGQGHGKDRGLGEL